MEKNNYPGKFIVLEGLDGSGQSTQAKLLQDFLAENGKQVFLTKEPTLEFEAGKKIKEILRGEKKSGSKELQELFTQDRGEHLEKIVIPALKDGKFVITDRYFFSTFAYGASDGLDLNWLIKINSDFLMPDITFILKVSPKICIERINKRGTKKELFEKEEKLAKVLKTYEILPQRFENMFVINGENSIDKVFADIKEKINKLL